MPTEAIFAELAAASTPEAVADILDKAGAKITYAGEGPGAEGAQLPGAEGAPMMEDPTGEGMPPPKMSPFEELNSARDKAIDKAMPPKKKPPMAEAS